MSEYLVKQHGEGTLNHRKALHESLMETANSLTTMLAEVAPEAILGNKFDTLVAIPRSPTVTST